MRIYDRRSGIRAYVLQMLCIQDGELEREQVKDVDLTVAIDVGRFGREISARMAQNRPLDRNEVGHAEKTVPADVAEPLSGCPPRETMISVPSAGSNISLSASALVEGRTPRRTPASMERDSSVGTSLAAGLPHTSISHRE